MTDFKKRLLTTEFIEKREYDMDNKYKLSYERCEELMDSFWKLVKEKYEDFNENIEWWIVLIDGDRYFLNGSEYNEYYR